MADGTAAATFATWRVLFTAARHGTQSTASPAEEEPLHRDDGGDVRGAGSMAPPDVAPCLGDAAVHHDRHHDHDRVHRAVRHEVLLVEGGSAFQDEAVRGSAKRQGLCVSTGDFAAGLAAIEFWGFAEVGQQVARHVPPASAGGVVLLRGDGEESVCVHGGVLLVFPTSTLCGRLSLSLRFFLKTAGRFRENS